MQKKTLIEKSLFTIAIISGLSAILVGIVTGCFGYLRECNESCKFCIPIIPTVFVLLVVSIVYVIPKNKREEYVSLRGLQERCGEADAMMVYGCFLSAVGFFVISLMVLMQDSSIPKLVALVFFGSFIIYMFIPIQWLEKIKKIKWKNKIKKKNILKKVL